MKKLENLNKKVIIIILFVIFIIMMGVVGVLLFQKNVEETENMDLQQNTNETVETSLPQTFKQVDNYNIYYTVKGILNNYITMIREANGDEYIEFGRLQQSRDEAIAGLVDESVNAIYNMFDSSYIEENNITEENINTLVQQYRQQGDYSRNVVYDLTINEMYVADISTDMDFILVNFAINSIEGTMLIKIDFVNSTYSIFGKEYLEDKGYNKDTEISNLEISTDSIESNNYNSFNLVNTDDKYVINQYFSEYQTKLLNNTDSAYELLDKDYREKKYEDSQEFNQYVEENYEALQNAYLTKYQINQFDEYKEYVCLDENNNYYIFIERSLTDYEVILDTYTVDLKDFTDKYNSADIPTKVGMNVEKVVEAINDKDYRYVYNQLDETFRNNNFGSLDTFNTYMNENFYSNNEMEYLEFSEEGDTYIYGAKVKNAQEDSDGKDITIIMKLLEGTDFVMSFSME